MASKLGGLVSQLKYTAWSVLHRETLQPTASIASFAELQVPESTKLVVLDKDNCFAKPHTLSVWPAFQARWDALMALNGKQYEVVVLSNTAGSLANDPNSELAREMESKLGVRVVRHTEPKPVCFAELKKQLPCRPDEVLIVGDRLVTDVLLANLMGARSVWIRPGAHPSWLNRLEMALYS